MISDMEDRIRDAKINEQKYHRCGCYSINSSGEKIYLKTNVKYHNQHNPICLIDQRLVDKMNKEYMDSLKTKD